VEGDSDADHVIWDGLSGAVVDGPVVERELPSHGAAVFAVVPATTGNLLGATPRRSRVGPTARRRRRFGTEHSKQPSTGRR